MRLGFASLAVALAVLGGSRARADATPRPAEDSVVESDDARVLRRVPHNAILLFPATFAGRGVSVGYERALRDPRFSLVGRFSFASPVEGDFRSRGFGFGGEGRFYLLGRGPFTRFAGSAPVGPYLGARTHLTVTTVTERANDRRLGRSERLAFELAAGYRIAIVGAIEISPFVGFVLHSDFAPHRAPTLLPSFALGLSVGGLFERR